MDSAGAVIETREVLAAAYLGPNKRPRQAGITMLSHAVEVGSRGQVLRVLCGRVSAHSIADRHAQDTSVPPTCTRCLAKLRAMGVHTL